MDTPLYSNAGAPSFWVFCGFSLGTLEEVDFIFLPDRQSKVTIVSCPESTERQESLFHLIYQSLVTASFYSIGL